MGYPAGPTTRAPKPPMSGPDIGVSIAALVVTAVIGIVAALFGVFSLAYIDYCPPQSCSAEDAFTAVASALAVAAAIGAIGVAVTIVALYRRRPAWPFAIATLVLCLIALGLGGVGYAVAVGA